jgi:hypothetical protein
MFYLLIHFTLKTINILWGQIDFEWKDWGPERFVAHQP